MDLIIVESPTKARTLTNFLGSRYKIVASMGHIRDLPKSKLAVDVDHNYQPTYETIEAKKKQISEIRSAAKQAKDIILATDPDREGEAIAFHLTEILDKPQGRILRITFHEITKEAVDEALKHPGQINLALVDAQQARRVLDRLVGYKLSPMLWKKVRRGLSAGRVQSVAVRLIVDREKEILAFKPEAYWEFIARLYKTDKTRFFSAKLVKINNKKAEVKSAGEAQTIEQGLKKADYLVSNLESKKVARNPYPPFTTSTLQQAAANKFYFPAKRTMSLAQRLYEAGLITYHRTDSVKLSNQALTMIRDYIKKEYGPDYLPAKPLFYKTKSKNAQEAHEAIRPTKLTDQPALDRDEQKLYELIKKRTVASQMNQAIYDSLTVDVVADKIYFLRKVGQKLVFDGWLRVWQESPREPDPELTVLAELKINDKVQLNELETLAKTTQPPFRYTEAMLVKALEEKGIGRPSTYAPIITTIQSRQYVEKKEGRFWPTPVGTAVTDFLLINFPDIMDYQFTAGMEDDLDIIAQGKKKWTAVVDHFYRPLAKILDKVEATSKRVEIPVEKTGEPCPECHQGDQVIRTGRFGKFLSCSRFPDCRWKDKYRETLPGVTCPDCGAEVVVKSTKRGKKFYGCDNYPKCKWASWYKPKPATQPQTV
jgi:DNA topoisomerase-1